MMHFKNHNPGFAAVEVMISILLLATFGTSLFMTQAQIFAKVAHTHRKVMSTILSATIFQEFAEKISNAKKQKKPFDEIAIHKEIKYPDATINLIVKKIPEKSELFKDFSECLQLVDQTITINDKQNRMVTFLFAPPPPKEAAKEIAKEAT